MFFRIPTNPALVETADFTTRPAVAGYEMSILSTSVVTFTPGVVRSVANGGPFGVNLITYPPVNLAAPGIVTLDVSTVFDPNLIVAGFGGCFPLPLNQVGLGGNSTVFPVLAIGDSSGKNPPTVIIPTAGTFLPKGYDMYGRVGQIYIDGTTFLIIPTLQTGSYEVREYQLATAVQVLSAGAAGSPTLVDLSTANGPITPRSTSKVKFNALFTSNAAIDTASMIATGLTSAGVYPIVLKNETNASAEWQVESVVGIDVTTGDAGVNYLVSGADALSLWVTGWTDDMRVSLR